MAKFFENNLRPEESFAGYNVGEPDDDIFQIKDNVYPDDIEEFIFKETESPEEEPENEPLVEETAPSIEETKADIISIEVPENDNNNIWDSFSDETETSSENSISADEDDLLSSQPITPIEIIQEVESANNEGSETEPYILQTNQEIKFDLDDDFKKQLAEQLASNKAKRNKEEIGSEQAEIAAVEKAEFVPVDEVDNAQFFDLSEFGNERPSEKDAEKELKPKLEEKSHKDVKEKKKNSKLPLIIGLTAASIVVLAGLAYLIMYYLVPNFYKEDKIVQQDSTKTKQSIARTDSLKKIEKPEVEKEAEKVIDKDAEKGVEKESEADLIAKINQQYAKSEEKKVNEVEKVAKKDVEKKAIVPKEEVKVKEQVKKVVIPSKKEKVAVQEKPKVIKQKKKDIEKDERKVDIVKESKPKEEVKKEEKIIDAVYTIQVYSSPSKEDALDWVNKLKSKNIQADISEQMIRDVKWYRVRFGNFSTREEAKAVALRYGFYQTWIDRIK